MPNRLTNVVIFTLLLLLIVVQVQAVAPGRLTVFSSVAGASACVDTAECDLTPADFSVEGNSWHTVVVTEKGYFRWSGPVYVTTGQTSLVNAVMHLDPAAIGFRVIVRPGGGTVCLDSTECRPAAASSEGNNSTLFTGVSEGYHTISVRNTPGFMDYSTAARASPGSIMTVTLPLTRIAGHAVSTGSVLVSVNLAGSTVCIDTSTCNQSVMGAEGSPATALFTDVTAGTDHIVTASAEGYIPSSAEVTISPDQVTAVEISLLPVAPALTPPLTPLLTQSPLCLPLFSGILAFCSAAVLRRYGNP